MQPDLRQSTPPLRERPRPAVRASWMTRALESGWARGFVIAVLAALFMAWSGALASDSSSFGLRLAYWLAAMFGGTALGLSTTAFVERRGWFDQQPWLQGALSALMMAVPYTLVIWGLTAAMFPDDAPTTPLPHFIPVLVVSGVMTAVNLLAARQPFETHAGAAGDAPPRFLERLPPKLRGAELYAVEAQDHYLRLHTSRGTDLILLRLADAVAELEGLEGAQTHRSWWVARGAVTDARRAEGRAVLVLKSGAEAPVSRRFARALREEGWF